MQKLLADSPKFKIGDFVSLEIQPDSIGQIAGIVFYEMEIGYLAKFNGEVDIYCHYELRKMVRDES